MEVQDLIELINLDESTRKKIEEAHNAKLELKRSIQEEKQRISEETWEACKKQVEVTKAEIDAKVKKATIENKDSFEKASKKLKDTFAANKEKWCHEIVSRCID